MTGVPYAPDAERDVLSSMLNSRAARETALELLLAEDFYEPAHATLFAAISRLVQHGRAVDVATITATLNGQGAWTRESLLSLHQQAPFSYNARDYCAIVADRAARRLIMQVGARAAEAAADLTVPTGRTAEEASAALTDAVMGRVEPVVLWEEFIADPGEPEWLVEGIVARGDRLLLVAREGGVKTTVLRQCAAMFSQGIHPWWERSVPPIRVLFVDCENPAPLSRRMFSRLHATARRASQDFDPSRLAVMMRPEGIDLTRRPDQAWLYGLCEQHRPDLLLIGPAYKLHDAEEESSSDVKRVLRVLDGLRARHRLALWMETHAPHESFSRGGVLRPAGSRLWMRWPEFVIGLEPQSPREQYPVELSFPRHARDERGWPRLIHRVESPEGWLWRAERW